MVPASGFQDRVRALEQTTYKEEWITFSKTSAKRVKKQIKEMQERCFLFCGDFGAYL